MVLLYMVTFTMNIPQMLAYIPYMDPMGNGKTKGFWTLLIENTKMVIHDLDDLGGTAIFWTPPYEKCGLS